MEKILELYNQYQIMPQLQEHQLRVAGVAALICDSFEGELDRQNVVIASLLHDMGNIIKFNLQESALYSEDKLDLDFWKTVQKEYKNKYGTDEHHAHLEIAKELGMSGRIIELISAVSFLGAPKNAAGQDFGTKIVQYCDDRVGPYGVVSLQERFDDLHKRYRMHGDNTPERNAFEAALRQIEQQIFAKCKISPADITAQAVNIKIEQLKNFEI